ncbi:unnamed protein product, partial [Brassica oleracea]
MWFCCCSNLFLYCLGFFTVRMEPLLHFWRVKVAIK